MRAALTILVILFTSCASVQEVNDPYSDTYNTWMEHIKRAQEIVKNMPKVKGEIVTKNIYEDEKYLSPKYIDPYKSPVYMNPSGSEAELRLMQPARSLRISKTYVSHKMEYTLSSNPVDNAWSRYNTKGYTLTLYGTYSDVHDIRSSFIPEEANLIYRSKNGKNDALLKGTLTVDEFLNFDFSEETIHRYFRDVKSY